MSLRKSRVAVSTCAEAEAAAEELLRRGNAVDAVIAGVFAACAVKSEVLLGPVQLLVGGAGTGLRAIDGRVRQPGLGAPRPRGFREGEAIPAASRIGAPWLPATLSVAAATSGTSTLAALLAPAVSLSKDTPRGALIARISTHGSRALEERPFASELLVVAGRTNEGLLTQEDLASPQPEVVEAHRFEHRGALTDATGSVEEALVETAARDDGAVRVRRRAHDPSATRTVVTLPWTPWDGAVPSAPVDVHVSGIGLVLAVDRHGTLAVAAWAEGPAGLEIPALGLRAPFFAEPVRRGVTRLRPGDPRPAPAPIALLGVGATLEWAVAARGPQQQGLGELVERHLRGGALVGSDAPSFLAVGHVDGAATLHR